MDVSKLPRLSKTNETAPAPAVTPAAAPVANVAPAGPDLAGFGADVWLALIIGIVFIVIGRTFGSYAIATLTHHPYHTGATYQEGPLAGTEVDYRDLDASFGLPFYGDSGPFVFGVSLLLAGAAQLVSVTRLPGKHLIAWVAIVAVLFATIYNIVVCAKLFGAGVTPLLSLLCVAFGGYEVFLQTRFIRPLRGA